MSARSNAPIKWTKPQKANARRLLAVIADYQGGYTALAEALEIESRATPYSWLRRGRVPLNFLKPLCALAPKALHVTAEDFSPDGRLFR